VAAGPGNITIGELAYYVYDGHSGRPLDLAKIARRRGVLPTKREPGGLDEYRVWDWRLHANITLLMHLAAAAGAKTSPPEPL